MASYPVSLCVTSPSLFSLRAAATEFRTYCWFTTLLVFPGVIFNLPQYSEGRKRCRREEKRQATPDRWVTVLISKGSLHVSLAEGSRKKNGSLNLPAVSQKFLYREILARFNQVYYARILNTTLLSQGYVLGEVSESKKDERNSHFKDTGAFGRGECWWGDFKCKGPACSSTGS